MVEDEFGSGSAAIDFTGIYMCTRTRLSVSSVMKKATIFQNGKEAKKIYPLGVSPGGKHNTSLLPLVGNWQGSSLFGKQGSLLPWGHCDPWFDTGDHQGNHILLRDYFQL